MPYRQLHGFDRSVVAFILGLNPVVPQASPISSHRVLSKLGEATIMKCGRPRLARVLDRFALAQGGKPTIAEIV